MKRRLPRIIIPALLLITGLMAMRIINNRPVAVDARIPVRREVVEIVIASGYLRAKDKAEVGSEVTGQVQRVYVDEGDNVYAGQPVVILSSEDAQRRLNQARLAAESARRQLELASRKPLPEEIARARAQVRQADRVGKARLDAAIERLKDLQKGGLEQDIKRAEAEVRRARAATKQAETDLRRGEELLKAGAISAAEVDRLRTAVDQSKAGEDAAEEQLRVVRQPASAEEIAAARAEVEAARADSQESVNIARESLNSLLRQPRTEDVNLARSRVDEAEAAVRIAEEEYNKRIIRSPISGLVSSRSVEPGQSVVPGRELIVVADMKTTEIRVETDENNLARLKVGQKAIAVTPAYPNKPFSAVLTQIGPEVLPDRGVVILRLRPLSIPSYARPEMTVDANIEVARVKSALSVPSSAVIEGDNETYIFLIKDGAARKKIVSILARGNGSTAISGISENDIVITDATRVSDGRRVKAMGG